MVELVDSKKLSHVFFVPESCEIQGRLVLPGWFYWDETGQLGSGPYATEDAAIAAFNRYAQYLCGTFIVSCGFDDREESEQKIEGGLDNVWNYCQETCDLSREQLAELQGSGDGDCQYQYAETTEHGTDWIHVRPLGADRPPLPFKSLVRPDGRYVMDFGIHNAQHGSQYVEVVIMTDRQQRRWLRLAAQSLLIPLTESLIGEAKLTQILD